jgi:sigma-B regulation protein RsbU (phosphoserine phosphatase)
VQARIGGDFYEFVPVGSSHLVFALLDIAGARERAMQVAAAVQQRLRAEVPRLFQADNVNESEALAALVHELNRAVLAAAGGVCCAPGFIGVFHEAIGTVCYCNAGHTPGLLRDGAGIDVLPAAALPLGLFSHVTYEPQVSVLHPGAVLLLASRGLVESRRNGEEFGLERLKRQLGSANLSTAQEICTDMLREVKQFADSPLAHNDVTVISLFRRSTAVAAAQG